MKGALPPNGPQILGLSREELRWADGFYLIWYEQGLPGWMHEAMLLAGARDVEAAYTPPPPGDGVESLRHQYTISWR